MCEYHDSNDDGESDLAVTEQALARLLSGARPDPPAAAINWRERARRAERDRDRLLRDAARSHERISTLHELTAELDRLGARLTRLDDAGS